MTLILLVRYVYIFHLKNPTAFAEDFWKIFFDISTIVFSILWITALRFFTNKFGFVRAFCLGENPGTVGYNCYSQPLRYKVECSLNKKTVD